MMGPRRALAVAAVLSAAACNRGDVKEWTPADHDNAETTVDPKTTNQSTGKVDAESAIPGLDDVTVVAWRRNCTSCHGPFGRGDGPQGMAMKATNLSDPAWQGARTDADISAVIQNGKGRMPGFQLPEATIANLVKLVRLLDASRVTGAPAGPTPSGAAPSATPSAAHGSAPAGPSPHAPRPASSVP